MSAGIRTRMVWVGLGLLALAGVGVLGLAGHLGAQAVAGLTVGGALVFALFLYAGATVPLGRGVRELLRAGERLRAGAEAMRVPRGHGEFAALGDMLGKLAGSMDKAAATLRNERDLMGGILEGMQDGIMLVDDADSIVLVNPAIRRMLLLPADVVGKTPLEIIRHAELSELVARARRKLDTTSGEIEVGGLKPRRLAVQIAPLLDRPRWLLLVFLDVTQIRRLESLRRDFVANVSHELRTPVSAIRSAAETLQGGALDDPKAARLFVDIIDRNGARLQQLIEDLLDLSRIESRELKLSLEPVALLELVEHGAHLLGEKAEKKQHTVQVKVPADLPRVTADRRAVEQILANLIDNAIKYCPPGAKITARGAVIDEMVEISIEDTGPGIEQRHQERLFERFYRVDPGRSRDMGGTGLGLSIVKHVVEAMGGEVGVRSEFGLGSTFWFRLPIDSSGNPATSDPSGSVKTSS